MKSRTPTSRRAKDPYKPGTPFFHLGEKSLGFPLYNGKVMQKITEDQYLCALIRASDKAYSEEILSKSQIKFDRKK